jgi:hypothetical protein
MKSKLFLIAIAIIGTVLGWTATNTFIVDVTIGRFIMIELIITVLHEMYNLVKMDILNKS